MFGKLRIKSEFGGNIAALMSGTVLAQALPIAASPILTRLYSPSDFGALALYMAIYSVIGVVVAGRYEVAIMLPKDNTDASNIMALSAAITLATSVLVGIPAVLFNDQIAQFLDSPALAKWLYLLPLSVMLAGFYQTLSYWNNRRKRFKDLAISRIAQGGGTAASQSVVGYGLGATSGGLISGAIIGQVLATLFLGWANRRSIAETRPVLSLSRIGENAKKYKVFPFVSSWAALLDNGALQMPLFIITKFFGAAITGLFSFTFKVLTVPLSLIVGSLAQVLLQKTTEIHNQNPCALRGYIFRILLLLCCMAIPFILIFSFYGVEIFSFVFGKDWARAGEFAAILSLAAGVRFVVSPLSVVLSLRHNVKKGAAWQLGYFVTLTTVLLLSSGLPIELFLKIFVAHEVLLYGIYLAVILRATRYVPEHDRSEVDTSLTALNQSP